MGKRTIVKAFLEQKSADEPTPDDWCYVNNFDDPHQPRALRLPAGRGGKLVQDMEILIEDLRTAIPAALELEEHRNRLQQAEEEVKQRQSKAFQHLAEQAEDRGIQLIRTPGGFALAPLRDGEVLSPEEYEKLRRRRSASKSRRRSTSCRANCGRWWRSCRSGAMKSAAKSSSSTAKRPGSSSAIRWRRSATSTPTCRKCWSTWRPWKPT